MAKRRRWGSRPPVSEALGRFGGKLRELRLRQGITQEDLGKPFGYSNSGLSDIEGGRVDVGVSKLAALLEQLGAELVIQDRAARPEDLVIAALESDSHLSADRREVIVAAYRAARAPRAIERRVSSRSRAGRVKTRTISSGTSLLPRGSA